MLEVNIRSSALRFVRFLATEVFADRDEFHFGSNDAASGVSHLCYGGAVCRAAWTSSQAGKRLQPGSRVGLSGQGGVLRTEIAVVFGSNRTAFDFNAVVAIHHPLQTPG